MKILIVDDEEIQRVTIRDHLADAGYYTSTEESAIEALKSLEKDHYDVVITDLNMPNMSGIQLLKEIKKLDGSIEILLITAFATIKTAVSAMKFGAFDYITKPFELDDLLQILSKLERILNLTSENKRLRQQLNEHRRLGKLFGISKPMQEIFEQIRVVAPTNTTVLITGATGTGKEIVAETIHNTSMRANKPLVKVNCAILSPEILESELFGHSRGAFTGANEEKIGRFEHANGGSIFLDDVDDIPLNLQVKLLRVLQEKEFERVGETQPIPVDVRVIASTKKDLYTLANEEQFRMDLFYRLNVFPINLPLLRNRKEDIPILIEQFLKSKNFDKIPRIDDKAMSILNDYPWEGNVRELKNLIERLSVICGCDPIVAECLPVEILEGHQRFFFTPKKLETGFSLPESSRQFENGLLREALVTSKGNKQKAASLLGIPISTLKSKLKKHNITI